MTPVISVIVPIYNAEKYLKPCLDSIVKQTLQDIEIILVDDGSTDTSLKIIQEYADKDKRIKIIKQKNSGPGMARNNGIAVAQGKFISFMDADDFFEHDMLQSLYEKSEATNADIVFCRFWTFNETTQKDETPEYDVSIDLLPENTVFSADTYPEFILNLYITAVWSSLYRRQFILDNEIKFSMATRVEDNLFAQTAVAMAKRICFLNRKLIHYRRFFNTSLTDKVNQYWKNSFIVHKEIKDYLISRGKYESLKNSFLRHLLNHIRFHVIERCSEPIKSFASYYAQLYLKQEFNLELFDIAKYTNEATFDFYSKIYRKSNNCNVLEKFYDFNRENIIPIVYAINEKFVPIATVSIQSIVENADNHNFYDIYILHKNLHSGYQEKLERLSKDNIRVSCINIDTRLQKMSNLYEQQQYSEEIFYRFMIPDLFYGYDKIIYLDSDTLVINDVAELIKKDITNYSVAGCVQPLTKKFQKYCIKTLNIKPEKYINSGVLVFNVEKWQELKISDKIFALIGKKGTWIAPDQDVLNIVCKNQITYIDNKWNCISNIQIRNIDDYDEVSYIKEVQNFNHAHILHFTSTLKPWVKNNNKESLKWWNYARNSIFYEMLLKGES